MKAQRQKHKRNVRIAETYKALSEKATKRHMLPLTLASAQHLATGEPLRAGFWEYSLTGTRRTMEARNAATGERIAMGLKPAPEGFEYYTFWEVR